MTSELVSILICTFNRSHCLDELLARLTTMFAGEALEILVFDDASNDDTPSVCAKYATKIKYICGDQNIGCIQGRACLIREARGEYLAFLDDDSCFIDRHALRLIRNAFQADPKLGVIACNIASPASSGGQLPRDSPPMEAPQFIGCGHVLKAEAMRKVGDYPAFLSSYGAEETLLALRMLDGGFKIVFLPALRVFHREDPTQRPMIERRASSLVNEVAIVISSYPLCLVVPGMGKKLLSHFLFNLKNQSLAALKIAVRMLPSVFAKALAERRPVRTRTLWKWYLLRRAFLLATAGRAETATHEAWQETESMFQRCPSVLSQKESDLSEVLPES